jgi:DNA helicase-2/ATP-dependent DNA helicase PcrA
MPLTQAQIRNAQLQQDTAAHDPQRQIRLIAGPGTGKSFAIQERVRWLLSNGVPPSRIYVVSFTRAAALDLKRRIQRYCQEKGLHNSEQVSVSTLHSLALRSLRAANLLAYPVDPCVMDKWELENVLDIEFSKVSGYTPGRCEDIRSNYEAFCGTGQWLPPNYIPPNPPITQVERTNYQQFHTPRTQIYSCVLPGEIVRQCVVQMRARSLDPASLLNIKYLVVDEYQDLNTMDLEFVDRLINSGVSAFVAGDDDQSIYSFRFASPYGIQSFTNRYSSAGDHELRLCFRCTTNIVRTAQALMADFPEPNRVPKQLTSLYDTSEPPVSGIVHRWRFATAIHEARAIARSCSKLIEGGIPPRKIMILVSNRRVQLATIQEELDREGIGFESPQANPYADTRVGRFVLAILRVICDGNDYVAHRLILGLRPHVGPVTCNRIAEAVTTRNLNFRDIFYHLLPDGVFQGRSLSALRHARDLCTSIAVWSPDDTLTVRCTDISDIISNVFAQQEVQEWLSQVSNLPQEMALKELRDFLWADTDEQQESLLEAVYTRLGLDVPEGLFPRKIRIMTMHGAKGLSAGVVFIPGLEENILPGTKRQPYLGLVLEAARLLYVSITRARAACVLTYAQSRVIYGQLSSQASSRFAPSLGGQFNHRDEDGLSATEANEIIQAYASL